ncbi:MAG: hypothetical protein ABIH82_01580 [Candidatus Woesearchaeota archaeon]
MSLKKIIVFILAFIIGNAIFGLTSIFVGLSLSFIFIIIFSFLMIYLFFKFSKLVIKGIVLLFVIYLLTIFIPFSECPEINGETTKTCDCVGFEKSNPDKDTVKCIGYRNNFECFVEVNDTLQETDCSTFR